MSHYTTLGIPLLLICTIVGCGGVNRSELDHIKAELADARAELRSLKTAQQVSLAQELERLDLLRQKGALTEDEFAAMKSRLLATEVRPKPPANSMAELGEQLQALHELYNKSAINNLERDAKKQQLISGPLLATDLKSDLETIQKLYNTSVINNLEFAQLKQRILEQDPAKK